MSTNEETVEQSDNSKATAIQTTPSKKGKVKEEDTTYGIVLYTDGSAQPTNPGYGGWGLHGFTYSHLPPTKGHGNGGQYLTSDGYYDKSDYNKEHRGKKPDEIKPLTYVSGYGGFVMPVTNNVAEVAATANGLAYAAERGIKKVLIKTDSKYAMNGTNDWLPIWKRNNWIKGDGTLVANRGMWETVDKSLQKLYANGAEVEVRWVKGHTTHFGNHQADKNADIGAISSMRGLPVARTEFHTRAADGYWNAWEEKHPFICQRRVYYSSQRGTSVPGEYNLGDHGKDDEAVGKRTADGCHSFIRLEKPEVVIEQVRKFTELIANGEDSICMVRLDKLYETSTFNDVLAFGDACFKRPHKQRLDLEYIDGEPLTKEFKPPMLIKRTIDSLNTLKGVLETWEKGEDDGLVATDVTDVFYELDEKGNNRIKPEFVVGFSNLSITAFYGKTSAKQEDKIDLCLGVDLPDRNALKKLEKLKPQVVVVTWMESEKAYRYATIVKAGNDIGIWAGMHSNLRVLVEPSTSSPT